MVRRIYVEKKTGFDVEAKALFDDVKEEIKIRKTVEFLVANANVK